MIDDEHGWQFREISGQAVATCDLCGQPVAEPIAVALNGSTSSAVADKLIRVCGSCFTRIEKGDLPVDPEADNDFDPTV
jgi:hypothetical protein